MAKIVKKDKQRQKGRERNRERQEPETKKESSSEMFYSKKAGLPLQEEWRDPFVTKCAT